jgi:hypothetical protein
VIFDLTLLGIVIFTLVVLAVFSAIVSKHPERWTPPPGDPVSGRIQPRRFPYDWEGDDDRHT